MQDNPPKEMNSPENDNRGSDEENGNQPAPALDNFYYVRFRTSLPAVSATSRLADLERDALVMVQTDNGLEPAKVTGTGPPLDVPANESKQKASHLIVRRATRDEEPKIERLPAREAEAFAICRKHIEKHRLAMKLTRVERLFNGSKIIFYFTAENRVDFRELVKDLVQEFRTRVEIRQIGVRHETKMIGGLGGCGRELCCSSFLKDFAPVSIKMAKEQNLPLNPAKISGVCNRLLCCLTYEYKTYHKLRKGMPRPGKTFTLDGSDYKVIQSNILKEEITIMPLGDPDLKRVISKEEWLAMRETEPAREGRRPAPPQKQKSRSRRPPKGKKPHDKAGSESRNRPRPGEPQED